MNEDFPIGSLQLYNDNCYFIVLKQHDRDKNMLYGYFLDKFKIYHVLKRNIIRSK